MSDSTITVVCDRCRTRGVPGEGDFAGLEDLLDFEPVPRKTERVDGWTAERQHAFIAALASTGSPRRAAAAVGKAQWGAEQLCKAEGGAGFNAAWERALEISRDKGSRRLAAGVGAVQKEDESWAPSRGPWGGSRRSARTHGPPLTMHEEEARKDAKIRDFIDGTLNLYMIKLRAERRARLEGRIVEADYYIRQVTVLEVILDCLTKGEGARALADLRYKGHHMLDIVETEFSRVLDDVRAEHFEECGDPPRPRPPRHLHYDDGDGIYLGDKDIIMGGPGREERERALQERHKRDAKAQVEWEAEARRDYEARRAASQPIGEASAEDLPQAGREANEASAGRRAPRGRQD